MRAILPGFLVMVISIQPAWPDEQRTFDGKTIDGWREVLRDKSARAVWRRQAVWALGCFGPEAKAAVPDLIEALRDEQFKDQAAESLAQIGSGAEAAVPTLIERFLKQGCQHLTGQGTIFYDDSTEKSLVSVGGPAVPALVEVLNGPNIDMRVCAAEVLGRIGPAARAAIPSLIREIEHPDPQDKPELHIEYAIKALGGIGPEAKEAVPALNHRLLRQGYLHNLVVEFEVLVALDRIGAPPVAKLLEVFLRDADPDVAEKLAWLGPKAREAIPSLRAALMDERPQARIAAAVALAHIDPSATESIPVLIEGLKHPGDDLLIVLSVPMALARLGPRARPAIPTLIDLVKKGRDDWGVPMALVQIDPEGTECVPALISALEGRKGQTINGVAAECLGLLGERAKDAVPALARILNDDFARHFSGIRHPHVIAAKTMRRIGPEAKSAIPALIGALKYRRVPTRNVRGFKYYDSSAAATVAEVLSSFGAEAKAAIPELIEVIRTDPDNDGDGESLVRQAAIIALGRMGADAKTVIPALRNLVMDELTDPIYLSQAAALLCRLDPDGKGFVEKWLEKPWVAEGDSPTPPFTRFTVYLMENRALVLGALGRTSVEGDCLTRHDLKRLDQVFAQAELMPGELPMDVGLGAESWFEDLGRLGVGGRLAIPRLIEFRDHPNLFVRMWASEALAQILPKDTPLRIPSRPTKSVPVTLPLQ